MSKSTAAREVWDQSVRDGRQGGRAYRPAYPRASGAEQRATASRETRRARGGKGDIYRRESFLKHNIRARPSRLLYSAGDGTRGVCTHGTQETGRSHRSAPLPIISSRPRALHRLLHVRFLFGCFRGLGAYQIAERVPKREASSAGGWRVGGGWVAGAWRVGGGAHSCAADWVMRKLPRKGSLRSTQIEKIPVSAP